MSDLLFCLQGRNPSDGARLRLRKQGQGLRKRMAFGEASLPGRGDEWEKWGDFMEKRLAIATYDSESVRLYARQVRDFLGDGFSIDIYSVQEGTLCEMAPADVYMISTCAFIDRDLTQIIPDDGAVVITEVHITREGLARLQAVPRNTRALLVNINQPMVTETIALFNQLGVNHIQFVPYYPGAPEPPHLSCAITTGEGRSVPEWVEEVIDLGPRLLSANTFVELAFHLKCEHMLTKPRFLEYAASLAEHSYSIERMFHRSIQVESLFDLFQQALDAGVVGVDADGTVFACNHKAEEILDTPASRVLDRQAKDCLSCLPLPECFAGRKSIRARLVEIGGSPVNVSIQPILRNGRIIGAFCILQRFRDEEKRQQKIRRQLLGKGHVTKYTFDSIIGESQPMVAAKAVAKRMAASSASILITGESGTGKELFAHAIHAASARSQEPFVAISCGAIPDSLLESQLFGYEEGAFTGARKGGHIGFFEAARSGTLFLDEIEAMSPMLQVKLLRVLQEKEIVRVGGVDIIHVDMRIIAATNEDLAAIVRQGGFRKDLYYRLCVLPLDLPPLRERGRDVELLLRRIREGLGAKFTLSPQALRVLMAHRWDGNVRELHNCVEYLAYLDQPVIEVEDLPATIRAQAGVRGAAAPPPEPPAEEDEARQLARQVKRQAGGSEEAWRYVMEQLRAGAAAGRKSLAAGAARLGIGGLSEQSARTILGHLEGMGLAEVRRGRAGSRLTPLGEAVYCRLQELEAGERGG